MKSLLIFPAAFMANSFALTMVMIGLSLFGKSELAADFGIVHGATVALFYAFSGNARSLILSGNVQIETLYVLKLRCLLLVPLYVLSVGLSVGLVASSIWLVLVLVARRAIEWLAEVFLSEQEHESRIRPAIYFFLTQATASLLLLVALCVESKFRYIVLIIWAVSPLFWCVRWEVFLSASKRSSAGLQSLKLLLPHFGSTAVIGISVYVLRVFVVLLAGRAVAGDFFSAFALGGVLGSIFAQALGPTFVHNENNGSRAGSMRRLINAMVLGALGTGGLIAVFSLMWPDLFLWTKKSALFWLAVGCSLIGSAVMVKAQKVRLRLLQNSQGKDAFGSDMLANIFLVACIPFICYGLGVESLSGLYMFGAFLSYVFYTTESSGLISKISGARYRYLVLLFLVTLIFLPLFFQLPSAMYQGVEEFYSVDGRLVLLPVPLSILACYFGIVLLGRYSSARFSLVLIFFSFVIMFFTSLLVSSDYGFDDRSKLMLLLQYMLPMFALVLGQQFGVRTDADSILAKSLFCVLVVVVPLQLIFTMTKGAGFLSSNLYLFSIYYGASYIPVVFVGAFLILLFSHWEHSAFRLGVILLAFLMGAYSLLSASFIAFSLYVIGVFCFFIRALILRRQSIFSLCVLFVCCVGIGLAYTLWIEGDFLKNNRVTLSDNWSIGRLSGFFEDGLAQRISYWKFYTSALFDNSSSLFVGHSHVLDRREFPSAYNYYLDLSYSFGVLAVLPLFVGIVFTFYTAIRNISRIFRSEELCGLFGVVAFLLLVDNFLQVGMRQSYSGIVVFFLWGILLSKLLSLSKKTGS